MSERYKEMSCDFKYDALALQKCARRSLLSRLILQKNSLKIYNINFLFLGCVAYLNTEAQILNKSANREFNLKSGVLIYQDIENKSKIFVEELKINHDSIYTKKIYLNLDSIPNSSFYEKFVKNYKNEIYTELLDFQVKRDTILHVSEGLFIDVRGEVLIDINAPLYNENDTFLILSNTLFLKQEVEKGTYTFIHQDAFSSHGSYCFTYILKSWIVAYEFDGEVYQLVYSE
jgi:hypothetical protein